MSGTGDHAAYIVRTAGRPNVWQVRCPTCGKVGSPQLKGDAKAIAERHLEMQGFERFSQ